MSIIKKIKALKSEKIETFINKRIEYLIKYESKRWPNIGPSVHDVREVEVFIVPDYDEIFIQGGVEEIAFYVDDLQTIYSMLINKIKNYKEKITLDSISKIVASVVFEYIGGPKVEGGTETRLQHIKPYGYELSVDKKNYLSAFKGSKHAFCVERAVIAHEIFKFLGLDASFVYSNVSIDGKIEMHSFNLLKMKNKTYLFDASLIDLENEETIFNNLVEIPNGDLTLGLKRVITSSNGEKRTVIYNPDHLKTVTVSVDKGHKV